MRKKKDKTIKSILDLIKYLKKDVSDYDGPVWFRGHSNAEWKLTPSLFRMKNPPLEMNLIKKFKQNATLLLNPRPDENIDWLFIMRHYGVPTRLLDWSESPLIATYFAINENDNDDGSLSMLLPIELNKHANITPDYEYDIPAFGIDNVLNNYAPDNIAFETSSELMPVAFIAPRNNQRMQSQLSVFTISHRNKTSIEKIGDMKHVWKYIIPKENKQDIKNELELLGINRFHIYPELESIGQMLKVDE